MLGRLACLCFGFFSFGFSIGFGRWHRHDRLGFRIRRQLDLLDRLFGLRLGLRVRLRRPGWHVVHDIRRDRDRGQIDHDYGRVRDQIGILAPSRKERRSAGGMKSNRKHKTRAPAGGLGPPAERECLVPPPMTTSCRLRARPAPRGDSRRRAARSSGSSARHREPSCRRAGRRAAACRPRLRGRARPPASPG